MFQNYCINFIINNDIIHNNDHINKIVAIKIIEKWIARYIAHKKYTKLKIRTLSKKNAKYKIKIFCNNHNKYINMYTKNLSYKFCPHNPSHNIQNFQIVGIRS